MSVKELSSSNPAVSIINSLELGDVIKKVIYMHGYTRQQATKLCEEYKRFLFLKTKYGCDSKLIPPTEVDDFWHQHILYTREYAKDCQRIFGEYLHHPPAPPWGGAEVYERYRELVRQTQEIYLHEFGEYPYMVRPYSLIGILRKCLYRFRIALLRHVYFRHLLGSKSRAMSTK